MQGDKTALHVGDGKAQLFFEKFAHVDPHLKHQGIFALDFVQKDVLQLHAGFQAVDEAVDVHFQARDQVGVLPEIQAEQAEHLVQGLGHQLFGVQPPAVQIHIVAGIVGSSPAHDHQGEHADLAVVDLDMQPLADAVKKGFGDLVFNGVRKALAVVLHVDVVGAVHPLNAGSRVENQHGKQCLVDGVIVFLQHFHENVLDLDQVKAAVQVGQGI